MVHGPSAKATNGLYVAKTLALATDNNADKMTALKIEGKTLIPPLEIAITKGDTGQLGYPLIWDRRV